MSDRGGAGRPRRPVQGSRTPARLAVGLVAMVALAAAGCGGGDGDELRGRSTEPAPQLPSVSLPDASRDGTEFTIRAESGQLLLVYFGYTHCPDVCPTTLADVAAALRDLDDDEAARVGLAMVTIDPDRDDGEILTGYVGSFVPGAHALVTTDQERLRTAADAFGVTYAVELTADGSIDVTHTSSVYAVDDDGRIPVLWPFGTPAEDMADDLRVLLGRA